MTITRRSLADMVDAYDAEIRGANEAKREEFKAYRAQLESEGRDRDAIKAEIAACKAAIRKRQKINEGKPVEEQDDLIDAVFVEITSPRASRDAREDGVVPCLRTAKGGR